MKTGSWWWMTPINILSGIAHLHSRRWAETEQTVTVERPFYEIAKNIYKVPLSSFIITIPFPFYLFNTVARKEWTVFQTRLNKGHADTWLPKYWMIPWKSNGLRLTSKLICTPLLSFCGRSVEGQSFYYRNSNFIISCISPLSEFLHLLSPYCRWSIMGFSSFFSCRCTTESGQEKFECEDYAIPYYDCVPADPTFDDMKKVVVTEGYRPEVPARWNKSKVCCCHNSLLLFIQPSFRIYL